MEPMRFEDEVELIKRTQRTSGEAGSRERTRDQFIREIREAREAGNPGSAISTILGWTFVPLLLIAVAGGLVVGACSLLYAFFLYNQVGFFLCVGGLGLVGGWVAIAYRLGRPRPR